MESKNILLIEDNLADARLISETLKENFNNANLSFLSDGAAAMEYLLGIGYNENYVKPNLILLDINLPKKNGFEVLSEIKTNKNLKRIPVIVLSSSKAEEDVFKSYDLHANCYITKPLDLENFIKVIQLIDDFWLKIVQLPLE